MLSELSTAFSSEYSRDKPKMVRFVQFSYNVSCDDDYHICRLQSRWSYSKHLCTTNAELLTQSSLLRFIKLLNLADCVQGGLWN